ncbi:ADP-ribosylation factor-like protein [Candidatus Halobeggiatoa sp. HSG11]|nr:ADP-ribosylation factor-like protein [Candidatus Halobeggiatoa sp. HSG11]
MTNIKDSIKIGDSPVPGLTLRNVLRGHTDEITRIAWSPNGRYLASPSSDKTIRIWGRKSGECIFVLEGHQYGIIEVAWSPDGHSLASASVDQTIRIWNTKTWETKAVFEGHKASVFSVAWSPDGSKLASGSEGATIRIWDTKNTINVLNGHEDDVNCVIWSDDGQKLVSCSDDGTVYIWDSVTGSLTDILQGNSDGIIHVAWILNNHLLASCSDDGKIIIWDVQSGKAMRTLEGHTGTIEHLSVHGSLLASTAEDNIRIWRTDTWETVAILKENYVDECFISSAFHPHLPRLATPGQDNTTIHIWDLDIDQLLKQKPKKSIHYTTAKIVLTGDSGVGKTGLGWRLAHGKFKEHASTHGQQFWVIDQLSTKRKDGTECEAVLWDLAGQHIYRSIHAIFLDNVDASLVLFDPTNRQDPLKGAEFWLEQLKGKQELPPTLLIGARTDRGNPILSQPELEQFCRKYNIKGYLPTSAKSGDGLEQLLAALKEQIPWEEMTATVTTVTFKRIKEYVLSLKESPKKILVSPAELRTELLATEPDWQFDNAELMTAVKHLENHGYVTILHSSDGEQVILLAPELLVDLASSIVLQADKHPQDLGAISEAILLQNDYPFSELDGLEPTDQQILLDAATLRFLDHKLCFRETLGTETLLIFPSLIKQKRPFLDETEFLDDTSYLVRGRVENIYAALVVLLGYTRHFIRINQWQNQAQYEMNDGQICGFRLTQEREGELELILYYGVTMPDFGHSMFQGLFEQFLYQRDVEITRFPVVCCPDNHPQERSTVIKRIMEGKNFLFCDECGAKVTLPEIEPTEPDIPWIKQGEALAHLRSNYETHLVKIKSYRRDRAAPRCYISSLPEQTNWVKKLSEDLQDAGINIDLSGFQNLTGLKETYLETNWIILIDTPLYQQHFKDNQISDAEFIRTQQDKLIPLYDNFQDKNRYVLNLFDLVLKLYAIPLSHPAFEPLRNSLSQQWQKAEFPLEPEEFEAITPEKVDIAILTVLPEEYQAVCNQINNLQPAISNNLYAWQTGKINNHSIAVGMMGRAGTIESALATKNAIDRWEPRYLLFVGIAGGLAEVDKGDVVIADIVYGYEYGKIDAEFTPRTNRTYKTDLGLLNNAVAHGLKPDWKQHIKTKSPLACDVKVTSGEIASGDKVVDNPDNKFFAEVVKTWPKLKAVEMEGAGVGNAIENAQALGKNVSFIMIRGISDLPRSTEEDENRGTGERDAWKNYAADTAAVFTISFITTGLPD